MASFQCSMFIKLFSYLLCFRQIPIPKIKKDKHQTETNTHREGREWKRREELEKIKIKQLNNKMYMKSALQETSVHPSDIQYSRISHLSSNREIKAQNTLLCSKTHKQAILTFTKCRYKMSNYTVLQVIQQKYD